MLLATTQIEDFDRFMEIFTTEGAEKRQEHGSKGALVFRDPDEADRVWVMFDWDADGWQSFVSDPAVPPIIQKAGHKGKPQAAAFAGECFASTLRSSRELPDVSGLPARRSALVQLAADEHRVRPRGNAFGDSPVHPLRRLSEHLGGAVEIWAKRDDCNSGLAYGGNKTRKLELLAAEALATGCNTLVSIGGVQSNHTRQVAAVAAFLGLECVLVQEHGSTGRTASTTRSATSCSHESWAPM